MKLCKVRKTEEGTFVEYRHKGSLVLASEAIIKCRGCGRLYMVSAENGIEREVELKGY